MFSQQLKLVYDADKRKVQQIRNKYLKMSGSIFNMENEKISKQMLI